MSAPTHSGWYAAVRGANPVRGHVVLAVLGADGFMLGRIEGEPGGPTVMHGPPFEGFEFHGPFSTADAALERLLEGDRASPAA